MEVALVLGNEKSSCIYSSVALSEFGVGSVFAPCLLMVFTRWLLRLMAPWYLIVYFRLG